MARKKARAKRQKNKAIAVRQASVEVSWKKQKFVEMKTAILTRWRETHHYTNIREVREDIAICVKLYG